jgi:hypothetical protein
MKMEEEDWKNVIDELTQQLTQVSVDRAVARADVRKLLKIIEDQKAELEAAHVEQEAQVQTVGSKKGK